MYNTLNYCMQGSYIHFMEERRRLMHRYALQDAHMSQAVRLRVTGTIKDTLNIKMYETKTKQIS